MELERLRVDAMRSLGEAESLPFSAYRDEDVYAAELDRIFHRDWVFVCCERELPNSGDYLAMTIGDEPILVLRATDGELRAMSNTCRHRGTLLLDDGFGAIDELIVCPYHAWAYDHDGALRAVPFAKEISVDRAVHCLPRFRVDTWCGLVFVTLSREPFPLDERLAGMERFVRMFEPSTFDESQSGPAEHWEANWKLAMENAMESYHLFKVHEETLEQYTPTRGAYYVAGSSQWSLTGGKSRYEDGWLSRLFTGSYPEAFNHYLLLSIPPSFVGVLGYGSLGWISVHPTSASSSRIRSGTVANDRSELDHADTKAFTEAFFAEDKWICERVQRGMWSRFARGGKLVDLERVVVDFHQYLATRLFELEQTEIHIAPEAAIFTQS